MKLVSFMTDDGEPRIGALIDGQSRVVDLRAIADALHPQLDGILDNMLTLLERSDRTAMVRDLLTRVTEVPEAVTDLEQTSLISPVPIPNSIRDCMSFERHLVQCMRTVVRDRFAPLAWLDAAACRVFRRGILRVPRVWHERPIYYKGNRRTVVGSGHEVRWPSYATRLDFELEFGVFIGQGGTNIEVAQAADHIAGYTMFNDFSARDTQLAEMQGRLGPAKGKDFDTGNSIGPWLTTPDEVNERDLTFEVRVNGTTWTRVTTAEMKFSFADAIAYISRDETLYPGDFIGSGTLPGGCGWELDRWIERGDLVELDGGILGVLSNKVV